MRGAAWLTALLLAGVSPAPAQTPAPPPQPAQPSARALSLSESVKLALQTNVKTRVSKERIRESEARIEQSLSGLLPQVQWTTKQANLSINLAQQGLVGATLPIPKVVGPFFSFDTRVQVLYNIIDSSARWRLKSSEMGKLIAQVEDKVATQTVTTLTGVAYVTLIGARHAQVSAQADLELSDKLVKLARDQKNAGVAAGIDVIRAEAQRAEQLLRLQAAADGVNRANLDLVRLLGLPLGQRVNPTEELFPPLDEVITLEKAHQRALDKRLDLNLAKRQEEKLTLDISAARAGMAPTMGVAADYGFAGNTPGMNSYGTHTLGLSVSIPLYDGGLTDAKTDELRSRLEQAKLNRADIEIQVEQDVRTAFLHLNLAHQQITTTGVSRALAERELKMASDRFQAGLANSLEVSTAQATLTRAHDSEVQAEVRYNLALVELAATMGSPEAIFEIYHRNPIDERSHEQPHDRR